MELFLLGINLLRMYSIDFNSSTILLYSVYTHILLIRFYLIDLLKYSSMDFSSLEFLKILVSYVKQMKDQGLKN